MEPGAIVGGLMGFRVGAVAGNENCRRPSVSVMGVEAGWALLPGDIETKKISTGSQLFLG